MSLDKMKDKMEKFNRGLNAEDRRHISNYFEAFTDGKHTKKYARQACYSPHLHRDEKREYSAYIGVSTHYKGARTTVPKTERRAYFKYLMTEHPLSHLYYKTSMKFADEQGMFVKTKGVFCNQLGYALKAIRIAWEHPTYINDWYVLIKAGMNQRAAAYMAGVLRIRGDVIRKNPSYYCHNIFNGRVSTGNEFISYLKGVMITNDLYTEEHLYYDSDCVFPHTKGVKDVMDKLINEATVDGKAAIGKNPFTGEVVYEASAITLSNLVDVVNRYVEDMA